MADTVDGDFQCAFATSKSCASCGGGAGAGVTERAAAAVRRSRQAAQRNLLPLVRSRQRGHQQRARAKRHIAPSKASG